MAAKDQDDMLRAMAQHRGLRLVKSRRRKPGGDFGRYGLADAKTGQDCFGFGKDGLTASAEDIEAYLRNSEASSWKRSLAGSAGAPRTKRAPPPPPPAPPEPPARRAPAKSTPPKAAPAPKRRKEPALRIRAATRADAAALAGLVSGTGSKVQAKEIASRLASLLKAKEPPLVADLDGLVGCASYHVVPTLHHGGVGRITLLVVAREARRNGVGRALMNAVEAELRRRNCGQVEAMSDIDFANAHGFFAALGFERTSYRFRKDVAAGAK